MSLPDIPIDLIIFYTESPTRIPVISDGEFVKIAGGYNEEAAKWRLVSKEEVMSKKPHAGVDGFYHNFVVLN